MLLNGTAKIPRLANLDFHSFDMEHRVDGTSDLTFMLVALQKLTFHRLKPNLLYVRENAITSDN